MWVCTPYNIDFIFFFVLSSNSHEAVGSDRFKKLDGIEGEGFVNKYSILELSIKLFWKLQKKEAKVSWSLETS